jgi:hypothetical protein
MPVASLDFDTTLYMATKAFHVGYGQLDDCRYDKGEITQPKTHWPKRFNGMIRTNIYTIMGDSRGPLFLEDNMKVVAMHGIRGNCDMLLPHQSYYVPITGLKTMNTKANNALEFIYTPARNMPVMPLLKLRLQQYDYKLPDEQDTEGD